MGLCQPFRGISISNFNKKSKMKTIIYIVLTISLFVACSSEEKINWDLPKHEPMLVVNGLITNEVKQQAIYLTQTNEYFDSSKVVTVSGALVHVMCNKVDYSFTESAEKPGLYLSDKPFAAIAQQEIKLSVQLTKALNGKLEYQAVSTMPIGMQLDSIECELYTMPSEFQKENDSKDSTIVAVYYYGDEPLTMGDYYIGMMYRNGKPLCNDPREYISIRDEYRNGEYVHVESLNKNSLPNDLITFKILSVEKKYWTFIRLIQSMDNSGDPYSMSGPPANAVGNVDGALGYFLAARVSEKSAKIIDKRE